MNDMSPYYWAAIFTINNGVIAILSMVRSFVPRISSILPSISETLKKAMAVSNVVFGPEWVGFEKPILILDERFTVTYTHFWEGTGIQRALGTFQIQSSEFVFWRERWNEKSLLSGGTAHEAFLSLSPGGNQKFLVSGDEFSLWVIEMNPAKARIMVKKE